MFKLTVICSLDIASEVLSLLEAAPEVKNILQMDATVGDDQKMVVNALVHREAIDIVLEQLRTLQEWQPGEISFIEVDYSVQRDLKQLDVDLDEDDDEDIIGWEMIQERARAESHLTWWYLIFMACAGLLAAIGFVANVPLLILGAMSLSPDLAPTNAIAVSLTAGGWRNLFRSFRTLILGLGVALVVSFLATILLQISGIHDGSIVIDDNLIAFVTVVSVTTVIVALTAGVAAMTAFVTSQATTAVGVAISVTTIPAVAYAGVALASTFSEGTSALIVLAVNIIFLTLAQAITLVIIRAWRVRRRQKRLSR
jgi:uncharacterized hydrophobic protein (TIGR00271 family)